MKAHILMRKLLSTLLFSLMSCLMLLLLNGGVEAGSPVVDFSAGKSIPGLDILPMSAVFFSLYKDQSKEQFVTIVNKNEQPVKIIRMETDSKRFKARLETVREGREYRLHVAVGPGASLGRTMEKVTLFTDKPEWPGIDIGVNIFIKGDVYNFPDKVDFGRVGIEDLKKNASLVDLHRQTVLVKRQPGKGKDFQIKLEHNIPFINIKKDPESGSETYQLDIVLIPEKMVKGKINAFVSVITNDKEVPEIKIPVVGEVQ